MHPDMFAGTPFATSSFDFFVLIGFVVVMSVALIFKPRDFPISRGGIFGVSVLALISGFLGGKLLYMLIHRDSLFNVMGLSFGLAFLASGYAFLGTLVFEILALVLFAKLRRKPVSLLILCDYGLPLFLLHQVFTRIGCFMVGCCYGPQTKLPWGCVFAGEAVARHPTQLYFAASMIAIFFIAVYLYNKHPARGTVFFTTLMIYGLSRCFLESWRVDSPAILGPVTLAQVATFIIALSGGIGLYIIRLRSRVVPAKNMPVS